MDRPPPTRQPQPGGPSAHLPGWPVVVMLAAVLVLHAALARWAITDKSVTADEILHVTQGHFANRHGDFRVQPENGMLPQRLHGVAAWLTGAPTPELRGNEAWRTASGTMISHQFFYETGHDHFPMLVLARTLNLLFSLGTTLLVFWWGRRLGGPAAGLVAAAGYALDPNVLAHAALATSDQAAGFFLLTSGTLFWLQLLQPRRAAMLASAAVFGLACVAKYSAVLLLPLMAGLIAIRILGDDDRRRWWRLVPCMLLVHGLVAVALIWACYGFRYTGFSANVPPAAHYAARWEQVLPHIGIHGTVVEVCRKLQLLPEAFLYGYAWVVQSARARSAFLAGEYSIFGWVSFFPLTFLWKSTPALLLALVSALIGLTLRWKRRTTPIRTDLWSIAPLLLFLVLYWGLSLTSRLNIGHRHILPTYPVLYVLLGVAFVRLPFAGMVRAGAIGLLVAGQAVSAVTSAPHFLAYFNSFAGGPANGYRLLVDSSLDWGQDLAGLDRWLKAHNSGPSAEPVYLSYFGSGEPNYYGIRATRLPFINGFKFMHPRYEPRPGFYCISATMLQQVYSRYRGPWTPEFEQTYRRLRQQTPDLAAWPQSQWQEYDELRFARLCHQLRTRAPDHTVGYSILIYRVSAEELAAALD
jgi:4-amino-4-deoxy-L-arabinose transferase-like glycosyltransferase